MEDPGLDKEDYQDLNKNLPGSNFVNTPMGIRFELEPYIEDIKPADAKSMKLLLAAR